MYLNQKGIAKVNAYLHENGVKMNCSLCGNNLIVKNAIIGLIGGERIPMGPPILNNYCQIECEKCGDTHVFPMERFKLRIDEDYSK